MSRRRARQQRRTLDLLRISSCLHAALGPCRLAAMFSSGLAGAGP